MTAVLFTENAKRVAQPPSAVIQKDKAAKTAKKKK